MNDAFGPPAGPPAATPPPAPTPGRHPGTAALWLGVLAVPAGLTVFFGVLLGGAALLAGSAGRAKAAARGLSPGPATLGMWLGAVALVVSGATYLWAADDFREFKECRRASLTFAQDKVCDDAFVDGILGR